MVDNDESAAIVSAIVNLGASLGLPVTAEGIETNAVKKALGTLGCDSGQGWLIGRPVPAAELQDLLRKANLIASPQPLPSDTQPSAPAPLIQERPDSEQRKSNGPKAA